MKYIRVKDIDHNEDILIFTENITGIIIPPGEKGEIIIDCKDTRYVKTKIDYDPTTIFPDKGNLVKIVDIETKEIFYIDKRYVLSINCSRGYITTSDFGDINTNEDSINDLLEEFYNEDNEI